MVWISEHITAEEINVGEFIKVISIIVAECDVMRVGRAIIEKRMRIHNI